MERPSTQGCTELTCMYHGKINQAKRDGTWIPPWVLMKDDRILARFDTEPEAREATYTGEYPDDVEVALINEMVMP